MHRADGLLAGFRHTPTAPRPAQPGPPRLQGVQFLRALAAVMVLIGHVLAEAEHYFALDLPGDMIPWTRGVDIFFVISGFIITLSASRYLDRPGAFIWRRFLRIAPLYYLFTTLMVAVLLVMPGGTKQTALEPMQIVSSYFFVPFERHDGRIAPVLSLGWTLNYEMFFYALAALSLCLPRPFRALTAALVGLSLLSLLPWRGTAWAFWTNPLILEFLFGIAVARMFQHGWLRPSRALSYLGLGCGLALLVLLDPLPLPRFLAAGLPAAMLVGSVTLFGGGLRWPGAALGDASYALYLSHRFVLRAMTLLLVPLLPAGPLAALLFCGATCLCALLASLAVHRWIERPLLATLGNAPRGFPA